MNPIHENDPKGEAGSKKTPLHLLPPYALAQTALAHAEGARKYGLFNWRSNQVCATTYIGAMLRHLTAWQDGEDLDPDSGLTHLAKIAACCNILMDAHYCGTLVDDRSKVPTRVNPVVIADLYPIQGESSGARVLNEAASKINFNQLGPAITQLGGPDSGFEQHGTPAEPTKECQLFGPGVALKEITEARQPPPFHLPTPCCKYRAELSDAYPIFWDPFNKVVQCHNCGHQYVPVK